MIINKFLSIKEIKMVENYYGKDVSQLSNAFNNRKLQIFESKDHLITWLAISSEENISDLLESLLDIKIKELRKPNIKNSQDVYINLNPNIFIVSNNRYIYYKNQEDWLL